MIPILVACSAPPSQASSTSLPLTSTPAPSETPGPTATLLPTETSTPTEILPQDMPQEYKDRLSEWEEKDRVTVGDNVVSVDEEAWFQKNEAGEWEKVYYEQDGLRWTPSDLFGGRIKINPEKAKEIHDKFVEFYQMTNRMAGTSNSVVVPRRDSVTGRIVVGLEKIDTPIDTSIITIEFPEEKDKPAFTADGIYAPLTDFPPGNPIQNQHAGVRMRVDEDNHLTLSFISYTLIESNGNRVLSKDTDTKTNAEAATQIVNYLNADTLALKLHQQGRVNLVNDDDRNDVRYF